MPSPTNFILGITSFTDPSNTSRKDIVRVDFRDSTPLNGEGYDDDTTDTQTWSGPRRGTGTVHCRDPLIAQALKGQSSSANSGRALVIVGKNINAGGGNRTHTFSNVQFAQPGGDMPGGAMAPESLSVNFRYGDLTIT